MHEDLPMMITEDQMEITDADRKVTETVEEEVTEEIIIELTTIEVLIILQILVNYHDPRKTQKTSIQVTKPLR